ncbi:hypothetical protein L227DRAFT_564700 [Lentinus tigrinus ALCF2SS1-6]|uniref:Uncharacterized protein n=1 Tax=Lentinus tigrinus ALCF2SS1-6 TaxID=1328759 RepID=A0A5C2S4Z9_9APHY|nr:hypothetical protein L227DRAFT_564700 [Lentinus tigrinus ALCF2SS1-6]
MPMGSSGLAENTYRRSSRRSITKWLRRGILDVKRPNHYSCGTSRGRSLGPDVGLRLCMAAWSKRTQSCQDHAATHHLDSSVSHTGNSLSLLPQPEQERSREPLRGQNGSRPKFLSVDMAARYHISRTPHPRPVIPLGAGSSDSGYDGQLPYSNCSLPLACARANVNLHLVREAYSSSVAPDTGIVHFPVPVLVLVVHNARRAHMHHRHSARTTRKAQELHHLIACALPLQFVLCEIHRPHTSRSSASRAHLAILSILRGDRRIHKTLSPQRPRAASGNAHPCMNHGTSAAQASRLIIAYSQYWHPALRPEQELEEVAHSSTRRRGREIWTTPPPHFVAPSRMAPKPRFPATRANAVPTRCARCARRAHMPPRVRSDELANRRTVTRGGTKGGPEYRAVCTAATGCTQLAATETLQTSNPPLLRKAQRTLPPSRKYRNVPDGLGLAPAKPIAPGRAHCIPATAQSAHA